MTGLILGMAVALVAESFFSGSEIAMVNADRLGLEARAAEGHRGAARALDMLDREDRVIGTCLIGTNLSTVSGATLMALLVNELGGAPEWALLYIPLTVVLGEALPKTVYQHHSDWLAPALSRPLGWAMKAFTPLLAVVGLWSSGLRRLLGTERGGLSRSDIVLLLDEGTAEIDPAEQRMIRNLFDLPEVAIEDCMTPLVDVHMLPVGAAARDAVELAVRCGHSRIPIYQDRVDNIVGVLRITDLLFELDDDVPIEPLKHPIRFVPETKRADDLLHEMRRNREHLVGVVDEYGGGVGIVTIEDLLEEFIGEIHDERDERGPGIRRLSERSWRVPARTELDLLEETLGLDLPEGDYETVAGLVLAHLGRIPRSGEMCQVDDLIFRIEEATDRAIITVQLTLA